MQHIVERFGSDLNGLRIVVDCANGAYSGLAPRARSSAAAPRCTRSATRPTARTSTSAAARPTSALLQQTVRDGGFDLGIAFDGDGDRMLAVDEHGEAVDGDQIVAILALDLEVDKVAVTEMTNLGFHALMRERGIGVLTTDVGDRYVLEALQEAGAVLGGEQSGHVIYLRDHVTGDGLAAALLLCAALKGRRSREVAAVMPRYPQVKENVRVERRELTPAIEEEVERRNARLGDEGRVLVRPSGTEPLIRVLVEAEDAEVAEEACASIVDTRPTRARLTRSRR